MRHRISRKHLWVASVAALCFALFAMVGVRAEDSGKEFKGEHPLRVLKARAQNDAIRGNAASARGSLTIWLQNPTSVVVDGISIDVDLYNNNKRKVDSLHRDIDKLEPGEKKVITFRWDVVAETEVKPRFFIEYNARGSQKERFEGDSPSWQ
jgi:hypothetical protein